MHLFIDTNVILHYKKLDQIDWHKLLNTDEDIVLILPFNTIAELDTKKRSPDRIGNTAKAFVNWMIEYDLDKEIRPKVKLNADATPPKQETLDKNFFNRYAQDDIFLASVLEMMERVGDVRVVAADATLLLRCRALKIPVLKLPEEYELKEEDPREKELKQAKAKIARFENAIPVLDLRFSNDSKFQELTVNKLDFVNFVDDELTRIRIEHPYLPKPEKPTLKHALAKWHERPFTEEEVDEHNTKLYNYYTLYESYLKENQTDFERAKLMHVIELQLVNIGNVPANDIDVDLHFPDGFEMVSLPIKPPDDFPKPPSPLNRSIMPDLSYLNWINKPWYYPPINPNFQSIRGPIIKKTNSYDVSFSEIDSLKHNQAYNYSKLYIVFDSFESATGFTIEYRISAANIPDLIEGKLNVKVTKS